MTAYDLAATVTIRAPGPEILRWLETPELIEGWVLGVNSIEALGPDGGDGGSRTRLEISSGSWAGWTYVGEVIERSDRRLVRRYRLESSRSGSMPVANSVQQYERTVTYDLSATREDAVELAAAVVTTIADLNPRAARMGARAEQRALERSLERLQAGVEGKALGLFSRFRDSGNTAGPL